MNEGLSLLADIDADHRERILAFGELTEYERGTTLISEGRRNASMILVVEGVVEITSQAWSDRPVTRVGAGGIVGELSFVLQQRSTASATAVAA